MSIRGLLLHVWKQLLCMTGSCLLLTGCWDREELNQLAFTAATAVDYKDGKWMVSYQVVVPSAISSLNVSGASKLPVTVYSTEGKTIREAVWRNTLESPRHLYFSHNRALIVSSAAVQQGLSPLIDVYLRNLDSRETVSVLIADGEARQILNELMQIQIIPGDGIEEMISKESEAISILPNVKMYSLAMSLLGTTKSAVLPEIVIAGTKEVSTQDELSKTEVSSKLMLGRLAVLNQDKLAGWLTKQEALGVNFIHNAVNKTIISFKCKGSSAVKDSTLQITKTKTRLIPHKSGGHYSVDIQVKGSGELLETNCPLDLNNPSVEEVLEQQVEKEIDKTIMIGWEAVKKLKTDVVGFADLIHRKYPGDWKKIGSKWETEFVQTEIHPHVEISIKRVGLTGKSFKMQAEEK